MGKKIGIQAWEKISMSKEKKMLQVYVCVYEEKDGFLIGKRLEMTRQKKSVCKKGWKKSGKHFKRRSSAFLP